MVNFNVKEGISDFFNSTQRILTVSKKPDTPQYKNMARITAVGILILGLIGYLVELASFLLKNVS